MFHRTRESANAAIGQASVKDDASSGRPRWEYKVLLFERDVEKSEARLCANGSAGWELVAVGGRFEEAQYAYLKRRAERPSTVAAKDSR